jgi:hypothetical protein
MAEIGPILLIPALGRKSIDADQRHAQFYSVRKRQRRVRTEMERDAIKCGVASIGPKAIGHRQLGLKELSKFFII